MPRFYFDVREGASFTPDNGGLEFDSLDGAERAAAELAADLGRDRLPKVRPGRSRSSWRTSIASGF